MKISVHKLCFALSFFTLQSVDSHSASPDTATAGKKRKADSDVATVLAASSAPDSERDFIAQLKELDKAKKQYDGLLKKMRILAERSSSALQYSNSLPYCLNSDSPEYQTALYTRKIKYMQNFLKELRRMK